MEAGRELDALIAEKVMGLDLVGDCMAWDPEGSGYCIYRPDAGEPGTLRPAFVAHCSCDILPLYRDEKEWGEDREQWQRMANDYEQEFEADKAVWGHGSTCLGVVPGYSTDIAAAWEVVEKLQERGMSVGLIDDDNGHWALAMTGWQSVPCEAVSSMDFGFVTEKDDWADTAPHAICLAALKAVAG